MRQLELIVRELLCFYLACLRCDVDAAPLAASSSSNSQTIFPARLWIFENTTSKALTTATHQKQHDDFFAQTTNEESQNDKRPFYITIDNAIQASNLQSCIVRSLTKTFELSDQWIYEFIPDTLELLHGTEGDWHLRPTRATRPNRKEDAANRMEIARQRIECAKDIFKLREVLPLPQASLEALLARLLDFALSPDMVQQCQITATSGNNTESNVEKQDAPFERLERELLALAVVLYKQARRGPRNTLMDLSHIVRRYRRNLIDICLAEVSRKNAEANVQDNAALETGDTGAEASTKQQVTSSRHAFCLLLLSLSVSAQATLNDTVATVLNDISNFNQKIYDDHASRMANHYGTTHVLAEQDASDILDCLARKPVLSATLTQGDLDVQAAVNDAVRDLQAQCKWTLADIASSTRKTDNNSRKRKEPPEAEDPGGLEDQTRQATRMMIMLDRTLDTVGHAFSEEVADKLPANANGWQNTIADYFSQSAASGDITLKEEYFNVITELACTVAIASSTQEGRPACHLRQRQYIMADLPPRDSMRDESFSSTLLAEMLKIHPKLLSSNATTRGAFWTAFSTLVLHNGEHPHSLLCWFDLLLGDLKHQNRLVRLAAGYASNVVITEMYRHNRALNAQGVLGKYFVGLEDVLVKGKPAHQLTTVTMLIDLIR